MAVDLSKSTFSSIVGQERACGVLLSALNAARVPHAYLFAGPEGVGKRTAAQALAKTLLCENLAAPGQACEVCGSCQRVALFQHPDALWINFDYQSRLLEEPLEKQKSLKIGTVREMERLLSLKPSEGKAKIAFIDPAEKLVDAAAHALLKILEEPPPRTHLVLLTADPTQLLATLRSRCQWVRFRPLTGPEIVKILERRVGAYSSAEAQRAALSGEGSVSRAINVLEEGEEISFDWESAPLSELLAFCKQFSHPRMGRGGADRFLRQLLGRFQFEMREATRGPSPAKQTLEALQRLQQNVTPQLVLEVLLMKLRREMKKMTER